MFRLVARPRVVLYSPEQAFRTLAGHLLTWDKRVQHLKLFSRSEELEAHLRMPYPRPDVILVDEPHPDKIARVVSSLRAEMPQAHVILLMLHVLPEAVAAGITAGAHGILVKDEVGYGIASALLHTQAASFIYTPGLERLLRADHYTTFRTATRLPAWRMCDLVSQGYREAIRLSYLHGMEAEQVAQLIGVSRGTVYTYRSKAAPQLESAWQVGWYDTASLLLLSDKLEGGARWMHLLTCLPAEC